MNEVRRRTAILGAPGYIGQHFARLLHDHPAFEDPILVGSHRMVGRRLDDVWALEDAPPAPLARTQFQSLTPRALAALGVSVAFSALPSGVAGTYESSLAQRGVAVFTNAADHRPDPGVPLLLPEVNPGELARLRRRPRGTAPIVANPNCTATGLALALAPVWGLLRPREVHVSTYQALSGAGLPALVEKSTGNTVVPFIPGEEEKVGRETTRLLGSVGTPRTTARFLVHAARVPVRDGHLEAVTVVARHRPTERQLRAAWRSFDPLSGDGLRTAPHPPVVLADGPDRPQPVRDLWAGAPARARGMAAVVGRIRWEPPFLRLFVLSHNAVRGGAGGSVLNAELALKNGFVTP
ncbi:MAG: aspartate-semialdehyde dehydrogenase [Thermoplasmata archaeon]|nr:aspartate-semialdehyde dehydrogenase [Thermoplasmata archaeon]